MKPIIPFLLLGSFGVAGAVVGGGSSQTTKVTPTAESQTQTVGPVRVQAALERTHLPENQAGEVFARVGLTGIAHEKTARVRVPVSLTLVIDRSGSMGGENKMEAANQAACESLRQLKGGDRYSVVSFDNGAEVVVAGTTVSSDSAIQRACERIGSLSARGGTDMHAGLEVGTEQAVAISGGGRVNRLLLLSDGQPDTQEGLKEQAKLLAKRGVTTTTIGLGTDYNEDLMAAVADHGLGNAHFVESRPDRGGGSAQLAKIFATELQSMTEVVAKNAVITLTPKNGLSILDVVGYAHDKSGNRIVIPVGDVYAGRTADILLKVRHGEHAGVADLLDVDVALTATSDERAHATKIAVAATFTNDEAAVTASVVKDVAVKAHEWQASTALLKANEAYNSGDFKAGDAILKDQEAKLETSASVFDSAQLNTALGDLKGYRLENSIGGMGTRASMNKKAKDKARGYAR